MNASAFFTIRKVDEEKRLVFGRATQEVVDRSGEVMDYDTTKPYIEQWSAEQSEATSGKNLGNIRSMHRADIAAGKVVSLDFDDSAKAVDITCKITDDQEWAKVLDGTYAGFSIGGSYVKKWSDPSITLTNGKPATRYTAKLAEISLVDRPCVPTAAFFDVVKTDGTTEQRAFHQEGNTMSAELAGESSGEVNKGLWEAQELISAIRNLKQTHDQIGEGGIGAELEEQIRELGVLAIQYLSEELGEHIGLHVPENLDIDAEIGPASETDMDTDEDGNPIEAMKGDFPGHPFRGNQYRGGSRGGAHHGASRSAHLATVRAHRAGDSSSHRAAANYHRQAASLQAKTGNARIAAHHREQAKYHSETAGRFASHRKGDDVGGIDALGKAARTGQKALRKQIHGASEELAKMCKAYLDTYSKEDDSDADDSADKGAAVDGLAKSELIDQEEAIRKAVADAIRPMEKMIKDALSSQPVAPSRAPVLRAVAKVEDNGGSDTPDPLVKAAETDPTAAIKLAHRNPVAAN